MTPTEQVRHWFEYEVASHATVRGALEAVPAERREAPEFRKAVDLMAHLVQARRVWLFRLGGLAEGPTEIFPRDWSLAELAAQFAAMEAPWRAWLERLTDEEMERRLQYRALDEKQWENAVHEVLVQLHGHSLYHRGQVALLLRQLGETPPITDFIYATRRPV